MAIALVGVTACTSFTAPIDVPIGTEIDPQPFIGTWELVEAVGATPESPLTAIVALQSDVLTVTFEDAENNDVVYSPVVLTKVLTHTIFSAQSPESDSWDTGSLVLRESPEELIVRLLDSGVIGEAIDGGVISGTRFSLDQHRSTLSVDETGSAFRYYLENYPEAIGDHNFLVFARVDQVSAVPAGGKGRVMATILIVAMLAVGIQLAAARYRRGNRRRGDPGVR